MVTLTTSEMQQTYQMSISQSSARDPTH